MEQIRDLIDRIVKRVNINLREPFFDAAPYAFDLVPIEKMGKFYAFYGISSHHPLNFHFSRSSLAGSYFLGKCRVEDSVLYKSDIRGDELKRKGDVYCHGSFEIQLHADEAIRIKDSYLVKTLVHNYSHDPENLEEFEIRNTISTHYANIHGSPVEGCFLGPFSTIDLTSVHDCVIGAFSYVQVGELAHFNIESGTIWIRRDEDFNFLYRYPRGVLDRYVSLSPGNPPRGVFIEFAEGRKKDFEKVFDVVHLQPPIPVPAGTSLDRYAVCRGETSLGENVLVAQRAYLEDSFLGRGANAQENCYLIRSHLEGLNVTAHGAKVIHARLGRKTFVGFNSFLRGTDAAPLEIGEESIVLPHTLIDLEEPVSIPSGHMVWGHIRNRADLAFHSLPLETFSRVTDGYLLGKMIFRGNGDRFVSAFRERIEHILAANGAYFDGERSRGHAQTNRSISFNTIQPYPEGKNMGLYPDIRINP
jgi:carbonic anhydrase/acetyltransferase-like protein (isoleucine patch superfamily)